MAGIVDHFAKVADGAKAAGEQAADNLAQTAGRMRSAAAAAVESTAQLPGQLASLTGELSLDPAVQAGQAVADALRSAAERVAALGSEAINSPGGRKLVADVATVALKASPLPLNIGGMLADVLERQLGQSGAVAVAPSAPDVSLDAALRGLARLRDDGLLTDEEFAAQKARLLAAGLPIIGQ